MRIVQTVFGVFHHFELARELERRGHLDTIYSTYPWQRLKREGIARGKVRTFPWLHVPEIALLHLGLNLPRLRDPLSYANALAFDAWTSRQLARSPEPDVLIALSGSSLRTGREVQARGGRVICDRGSSHQRFQERIVSEEYKRWQVTRPVTDPRDIRREEQIYETADLITVPSTFAARSFVEMGVAAEKIRVIPYGVRLERFARTPQPAALSPLSSDPPSPSSPPPSPGRFDVLFAGTAGLRKGFPYLLQAFAGVRHSAKRLRVAGSVHPDLETVLERLPRDHVEFLGSVTQSKLAELMSTSHVMVLPSIEEGLALVQGQALACGCPVICSTNTGGEDLFTNGIEGFIVPVRDVPALTDKMQQLADDTALQQTMSEAALRRVQTIDGWSDYGDRWEALLRTLSKNSENVLPDGPTTRGAVTS